MFLYQIIFSRKDESFIVFRPSCPPVFLVDQRKAIKNNFLRTLRLCGENKT